MIAADLRPLPLPLTALLVPSPDADWTQARCAAPEEDPEAWFPFPTEDYSHAMSVCAVCPVRAQCADFGRINRMTGVWGGVLMETGRTR